MQSKNIFSYSDLMKQTETKTLSQADTLLRTELHHFFPLVGVV